MNLSITTINVLMYVVHHLSGHFPIFQCFEGVLVLGLLEVSQDSLVSLQFFVIIGFGFFSKSFHLIL